MKSDQELKLFSTPQYPCSYLPGRIARNYVVDPNFTLNTTFYSNLIQMGFRRSGSQVYKPECGQCKECVSSRILVKNFTPSRSQRRNLKSNNDLSVIINTTGFKSYYIPLYESYLLNRHDNNDTNNIEDFFEANWCNVYYIEFYHQEKENNQDQRLLGVAVVDILENGLSSVYTFFHPEESKRSLGTFAVLWQINYAKKNNIDFVYPGYWIKDCPKMNYKTRFQPLEGYFSGKWLPIKK
jgi:arginine-tRNA-protein transferase